MTTQARATSSPSVFAEIDARFVPDPLARLRRAWTDYLVYSRAHAELQALSIRQREDVGLTGLDLSAIARKAANTASAIPSRAAARWIAPRHEKE